VVAATPDANGNFQAAGSRIDAFNRASHELTVTARTKWIPGSDGSEESPRWWFTWVSWIAGKDGPPVNRRINRAGLETAMT
jgi:hypothetical protein